MLACATSWVGSSCTASLVSDAAHLHKDKNLSFMCFGHMPKHLFFQPALWQISGEEEKKRQKK